MSTIETHKFEAGVYVLYPFSNSCNFEGQNSLQSRAALNDLLNLNTYYFYLTIYFFYFIIVTNFFLLLNNIP